MTDTAHIRAVRNNNPGNIRVGSHWQGLLDPVHMNPDQKAETAFCVFATAVWGFRAMATIFHTYANKDGVKTIRGAISRWAPPNENNTGAYVQAVCQGCHVGPDDPFPFHDQQRMTLLLQAVSTHEVGTWAFSQADLLAGVREAG